MGHRFVYVTVPTLELARSMSRALIEERLAACVNILPGMQSIYRWNGAIEEATEVVLILKTQAGLLDLLTDRVRALHPYTCPCVAALQVEPGNPDYFAWLTAETARPPGAG
ncbi:MAG: divalent-cation tolerance protein CutA [Alphaproteobacteria bacterium]|nr:divalent-cation tolerance protein CutA [Alphaproteobacteria bacterium]